MKTERIAYLRAVADENKGHRSALLLIECLDEIEKLQQRKERKRKQGFLFAPTITDLSAYGKTIGLSAQDCTDFFDHHQARGWKYKGRLPMVDWQAALRTWKTMQKKFANGSSIVNDRNGHAEPKLMLPIAEQSRLMREAKNR